MKKFIAWPVMVFMVFLCWASFSFAQQNTNTAEENMAILLAEPPLTQADIDAFVKYAPELYKLPEGDDEGAQKILQKAGWTDVRSAYVAFKIAAATSIKTDPSSAVIFEAMMPEMMPLPAEQALVGKNMDQILKVSEQFR